MLATPSWNDSFTLFTDSSDLAVGGVFCQNDRPVAFCNRLLTSGERKLSTTLKECLSIVFCTKKLDHFLQNAQFIVKTDHKPLTSIVKEDHHENKILQRYLYHFMNYSFEVEYYPGTLNYTAVILSRAFDKNAPLPTVDAGIADYKINAVITKHQVNKQATSDGQILLYNNSLTPPQPQLAYAHKSIAKLNKPPSPIPKPNTAPENGKLSVLTNKHEPQQSRAHNHDNVNHTDSDNESTLDQHHGKRTLDLPTIDREQHTDSYYKHLIAYLELQI